ncbi:MAG: hypothetical protein ABJH63_10450 [Rhizobiaceae bacterium]
MYKLLFQDHQFYVERAISHFNDDENFISCSIVGDEPRAWENPGQFLGLELTPKHENIQSKSLQPHWIDELQTFDGYSNYPERSNFVFDWTSKVLFRDFSAARHLIKNIKETIQHNPWYSPLRYTRMMYHIWRLIKVGFALFLRACTVPDRKISPYIY